VSVLSSVLSPVLQPVLGSVFDASSGGPPRFRGLDLDFAQGRYAINGPYRPGLPAGWSFSRAGAGTSERSNGVIVPFASDFPRITDRGLLLEAQRTNKVLCYSANPTSMLGIGGAGASRLSLVNDSAALAEGGLGTINPNGVVYKLDNSDNPARAEIGISGASGNLSPHSCSIYMRGSGLAVFRAYSSGTPFPSPTPLSNGYIRRQYLYTPAANASILALLAEPGATVYFILPQLEEGTFLTSPIVTEGAAATRGTDSASITVPSGVSSFTAYYGSGQATSGVVTPGQTFDISASNRPWFNNYLQRLVMQ